MKIINTIAPFLILMTLFSSAQQPPNTKNDAVKNALKTSARPTLATNQIQTGVVDNSFIIPDNPQEVYRGT